MSADEVRSGERGLERVDLTILMREEAAQDLLEGALPVAEPEAAARRDDVELSIGQLANPCELVARGRELRCQVP